MYATLKKTLLVTLSAIALAGAATSARAADDMGGMDHSKMEKPADKNKEKAPSKDAKNGDKKGDQKGGQKLEMKVTDKGFEPANVTVKKGQPVTLVITRTTDKTCATDIVIDEYGIKTALPLNKAVEVSFTPKKAGELKYGCAMNKMIGGVLSVQ